jgi:hypothetical protein
MKEASTTFHTMYGCNKPTTEAGRTTATTAVSTTWILFPVMLDFALRFLVDFGHDVAQQAPATTAPRCSMRRRGKLRVWCGGHQDLLHGNAGAIKSLLMYRCITTISPVWSTTWRHCHDRR